ncbi:SRPBCC family protein [Parapedobacter sp. 10938]|uniref:SRPBCC family protein n=1 Tax=Parapedobacter flavus TaxID=3110225 RepID=UPI002DB5B4AB|nr:SRPBCC domain-containing protein [Parapedobacter sp. 10938]MEC3880289.1 SRPBCC domain-containing protein [Parapedobacter sp. 10938]
MNSNLLFDYKVNKENNTIYINREFDANLELVWKAWTTPELLDQWFGPKPFKAETLSMDFREGGFWLYTLISEEYGNQWGKTDYHKIVNLKYFTASDSFLDENHQLIPDYPVSSWKIEFNQKADITTINVATTYKTLEDLEKMIEWGYMDGFTAVMKNLDELLKNLNNKKK